MDLHIIKMDQCHLHCAAYSLLYQSMIWLQILKIMFPPVCLNGQLSHKAGRAIGYISRADEILLS